MKLSDFDYMLPKELIAQHPLKKREEAKLLVIKRKDRIIENSDFSKIISYLEKGDCLILNDTKVLPCRLLSHRKSGAKVEFFLLRDKGEMVFECMMRPTRLRAGEEIVFDRGNIKAVILSKGQIKFNAKQSSEVYALGKMPLPPYIKREATPEDKEYYQTVYAKHEGAVAAPTAGLHFTSEIINNIKNKGVKVGFVTLHVGTGTFKSVKSEDITKHKMDYEYFSISEETVNLIKETKKEKKRVIAVGTTTLRTLEAFAKEGKLEGKTDLFIYPGYKFKIVDALLTNFHLPKTTLYMLVCAFCGTDLAKKAYKEAIEEKYRFYSYGDAMLIL